MLWLKKLSAAGLFMAVMFSPCTLLAQQADELVTSDEVKADISQAMDAVAAYSAQERDAALTAAREAFDKLDAEIDRRELALRENWAELDEDAKEDYSATMAALREARNELSERFGALEAGSADAWVELKDGFANAYRAFEARWRDVDTD